jgi:alpha-glucuronidase
VEVQAMNKRLAGIILTLAGMLFSMSAFASDGYDGAKLWLPKANTSGQAPKIISKVKGETAAVARQELTEAWRGSDVELVIKRDKALGRDGFRIENVGSKIKLTANNDLGLLYGAYHLLRLQDQGETVAGVIEEVPVYDVRVLNHWDNLNGTVERGYAGRSIWKWEQLPDSVSPRYKEYARANASVGINGTVLNNVNASSKVLGSDYLAKVAKIADVMRPYGIKVYLSANFAAPMQLGGLSTADPLDPAVIKWWGDKATEIYNLIPDFGGFLVKANSEGQPGPCDFNRTHAEGANMLARALKPHGGIVMWRAFVYSPADADRAKQAYLEFQPLDGQFDDNVIIQIKNGPVDFQPREPYSPLFGAMPATKQMVEFQITQEYLGHSNHLAYLAPMWEEFFTYVEPSSINAIAGVSNVGDDANWTGHPFAQANWYAFGRLAWNPSLSSSAIAHEWVRSSIGAMPESAEAKVISIMDDSREAVVDYMMPMGLHHLFAFGHHYGPEPWCAVPGARPDWLPSYYHRADSAGVGFDRSSTGSNAVAQYPSQLAKLYDNVDTCPEDVLLWFHHVDWNRKLQSGETLWEALCRHYDGGVHQVRNFQREWESVKPYVPESLYEDVRLRLLTQVRDAQWWKDGCLLYFQSLNGLPFPENVEPPVHDLKQLKHVNLGIDNYRSPDAELLNKVR